jgi:hypothetical protein
MDLQSFIHGQSFEDYLNMSIRFVVDFQFRFCTLLGQNDVGSTKKHASKISSDQKIVDSLMAHVFSGITPLDYFEEKFSNDLKSQLDCCEGFSLCLPFNVKVSSHSVGGLI